MSTPKIRDLEFHDLLALEPHGPDTFVAIGARYPWGDRLFGGQVVAQALRAAAETVDRARPAHSLHSYFIRPGIPHEPIRYEVERCVTDARSAPARSSPGSRPARSSTCRCRSRSTRTRPTCSWRRSRPTSRPRTTRR